MKRYCKKVDIGNARFIQTCVHECLRKRCKRLRPLDVMGIRFSPRVETLRKRIFRRARRSLLRVKRALRGRARVTRGMALRAASFHGWLEHASCFRFTERVGERAAVKKIFEQATI